MTQYKAMVDAGIIAEYTDWDQYIASMNDGKTAGVVNGCWIMSSIQAAADQSGKWAIVNMPKLDGIDGATNYANCGGASWAVSSNCKNTELAYDFLKTTFGGSVELYDDLLPNAGAIASYLPAAKSDVYIRPLISTAVRLFTRTSLISQARFPLMIAALIIPISAAL